MVSKWNETSLRPSICFVRPWFFETKPFADLIFVYVNSSDCFANNNIDVKKYLNSMY